MDARRLVAALALLCSACAKPDGSPKAAGGDCSGFQGSPASPEVTYISRGRMLAASPDGSSVRCVLAHSAAHLKWGSNGDRLFLGRRPLVASDLLRNFGVKANGAVEVTPAASEEVEAGARSIEWSRPAGRSFVYISADGSHLFKRTSRGLDRRDISFLRRHDQVAYHPAGTHIAVSGLSRDDPPVYGIWLATNLGQDVRPLAEGETVVSISSFAFGHKGDLIFAARHTDHWDVHRLSEGRLETIATALRPYGRVVASEFAERRAAFTEGSCDTGVAIRTEIEGDLRNVPASRYTEPVGWLPDNSLLLMSADRCDGPGNVLRLHEGSDAVDVIARDVTEVAVRSVAPPPPEPPVPNEGAT